MAKHSPLAFHYAIARKELKQAGICEPPYKCAVHHIVPLNAKDAEDARSILEYYGIDIDSAANAVFLPRVENEYSGAAVLHKGAHVKDYYIEVNKRITEVTKRTAQNKEEGKKEVIKELQNIRKELLEGKLQLQKG